MTKTVPVSTRALLQRINRALAPEKLMTARGKARETLGKYYILNETDEVGRAHVDLEKLGRKLGVLQTWEALTK